MRSEQCFNSLQCRDVRDRVIDDTDRSFQHNAGGSAMGIARETAARRICCLCGDAGGDQCGGVAQSGVARDVAKQGRDASEHLVYVSRAWSAVGCCAPDDGAVPSMTADPPVRIGSCAAQPVL